MRAAWRAADIRAAEEALIPTLPAGTLMQRAAAGLARRCASVLAGRGGVYGARVLLLVGAGNNGGDALYAGARLAARGAAVSALLITPDRAHAEGLAALRAAGGATIAGLPAVADLVVDGILGSGARGPLRGAAVDVVENLDGVRATDGGRPTVVAVDVPSGVNVNTGQVEGPAVRADVTVTFGCLKPALVVGAAVAHAGHVDVVDIGLPWLAVRPAAWVPELSDIQRWWPSLAPTSDKYNRGVVGLATGSAAFPGAALMSVAGALAGPTGMVRYAGQVTDDVVRAHPSVIPTRRVAEAGRVQAWVCGCGLGTDRHAAEELRAVLGAPVPAVIDADALTLLGHGDLNSWLRRREAPTVVTPHDREFARLAGDQPGPDRLAAATELAAQLGVTVLLKGDRTLVATPEGTVWANPTGTPALATAGTGDVLAGLLGSLLAAGLPADRAAVAAAFVHGLAGRTAADRLGGEHAPVTAPDVAAALPAVIASFG
ncbi:NAD(P)H-hydrate dehydratase [Luedemannella helvata]|uniref:Bifunctional NAD(P)H-hydrate repair enzyme n=1 Tax=Luedemannella helvata TaxID=349315 RepID=A0ABP4W3G0_9ACTN